MLPFGQASPRYPMANLPPQRTVRLRTFLWSFVSMASKTKPPRLAEASEVKDLDVATRRVKESNLLRSCLSFEACYFVNAYFFCSCVYQRLQNLDMSKKLTARIQKLVQCLLIPNRSADQRLRIGATGEKLAKRANEWENRSFIIGLRRRFQSSNAKPDKRRNIPRQHPVSNHSPVPR